MNGIVKRILIRPRREDEGSERTSTQTQEPLQMGKQVNGDWRGPSLFLQPSPDGHPRFYFAQVALIRDGFIIITVCLLLWQGSPPLYPGHFSNRRLQSAVKINMRILRYRIEFVLHFQFIIRATVPFSINNEYTCTAMDPRVRSLLAINSNTECIRPCIQ